MTAKTLAQELPLQRSKNFKQGLWLLTTKKVRILPVGVFLLSFFGEVQDTWWSQYGFGQVLK